MTEKAEDRLTREAAVGLLKKMREIRQFEERIVRLYPTDVCVTPVHLHVGQEAVPVGVCAHLTDRDTIFFTHRSHGPALAKGMDMKRLMAELYGRTTGCSRGYGGSMHLVDPPHGMLGSTSIVGEAIAMGVGAALAAQLRGDSWISVSCFGDGATDSGVFWESLNFAALKSVPVLFLCENNFLSNVMPKSAHMFVELTSVAGNFMATYAADGTDVRSVYAVAGEAVAYVRGRRKPAFLECKTKRWMKHQGVEWDDLPYNPVNPQVDCPIRKLEAWLLEKGFIRQPEIDAMVRDIEVRIDEAVAFAVDSPFPAAEDLLSEV